MTAVAFVRQMAELSGLPPDAALEKAHQVLFHVGLGEARYRELRTYSLGMSHAFWYAAAAVLGCVGYGSIFLAVGLYIRNPIIPAAVLLAWEGINGILPHVLQKISILYYLQSLCPVPAPLDNGAPTLIRLLAAPAAPASRPGAVLGLVLLTAVVLWIGSRAVRRMEISYGAET